MTVIERIEGPSHPAEFISQIEIAIDRQGAVVNRLKNERSQRDMERQLLKDQDAAYHQSLKADQEKVNVFRLIFTIMTKYTIQARLAQMEKEALARIEEQAQDELRQIELYKEKRNQYIQYLFANLPEEPTEGKIAKLSFRLAGGDRIIRKFKHDDTVDVSVFF